jgi:MFS family permease
MTMPQIDREEIRKELEKEGLLSLHRDLTDQRRIRTAVMAVLLAALMFTIIFGTLEDPFIYTFSNIGNFFDYRFVFIVWSIFAGLAIQAGILALFRLEDYAPGKHLKDILLVLAVVFLVATAIVPALRDRYPALFLVHYITAILHAVCVFAAFIPFAIWVSRENPRLRRIIFGFIAFVWGGALLSLVFFGKSGLFEMWFFVGMILFLLYLSLVLFEEKIVKLSVRFLRDEDNLNYAIEKYFINLDEKEKTVRRQPEPASREKT